MTVRVTAENVERLARQFHETYERLAPSFGYETREESAVPWEEVPEQNRALMVAVVGEVTAALAAELEATKRELDEAREEVILANFDGHYARAEAAERERDEALAANEGKANLLLHEALISRAEDAEARADQAIESFRLIAEAAGEDGTDPEEWRAMTSPPHDVYALRAVRQLREQADDDTDLRAAEQALSAAQDALRARELQLANVTAYCSQRDFPVSSEVMRLARAALAVPADTKETGR